MYFEDLKRGTNKEIEPKEIFEIASNKNRCITGVPLVAIGIATIH
jgi:hypothetical protein